MPSLQGWEWLILILVVLLLFGAKKLPDVARGLGRSLRILKAETKSLHDDDEQDAQQPAPPVQQPVQQLPPAPPTYQQPTYQQPTYQQPTYQQPVQQHPAQQQPYPGPVAPPAPQHDPAPYDR